jgi:hypothetical protein
MVKDEDEKKLSQLLMDSKSIDTKLKLLTNNKENVHKGKIQAEAFDRLMINHATSGSRLFALFIVGFTISGGLAVLTALICLGNYLL